eukprot:6069690-Alexandrium_andersonii.AAC.1
MLWTTARGARTRGLTSTPSHRATACGSTERGPSYSVAPPRWAPFWTGPKSRRGRSQRKGAQM